MSQTLTIAIARMYLHVRSRNEQTARSCCSNARCASTMSRSNRYRRGVAEREYTSLTTYLNDAGALVVTDADGAISGGSVDMPGALATLRTQGWDLVEVETSETVLPMLSRRRCS